MAELRKGRIIKGLGGLYDLLMEDGEMLSCRARGHFRHENITPLVGDNVSAECDGETTSIAEILPRKNSLIRPPLANLDYLFIAAAAAHPAPVLETIDKLTAIACHNNIKPVIIITKCDLDGAEAERIAEIYRRVGFDTFVTGHGAELGELRSFVDALPANSLSAFAGASGVGKSTLMNLLFPKLELLTGTLSRKTERGRHTTRHVQLYRCGEAFIADTPGFSMLDFIRFDFFDKESLPYTFPEFEEYLGCCRYTKCTHTKEEGCRILEAVKEGIIPEERHASYMALFGDLKNKHAWDKK